jgi:hypothetical protein
MMTTDLAYWSNQPMHDPCFTKRTTSGIVSSCGYPIITLRRGGVLVMLIEGGMPGWKIGTEPGKHLLVDHHEARQSIVSNSSGPLRENVTITTFIESGVADDFFDLVAFFREPGTAQDRGLLKTMLNSIRIR